MNNNNFFAKEMNEILAYYIYEKYRRKGELTMANAIDDEYGIKEDNENDPKFGTYEYFEASHHNFHKKAELDAAGFIRAEENDKRTQV